MPEKKLKRSCKNRIIAGVAGGLGEYFDIDPVLFRLMFVLLAFAGAAGILIYIIAWLVIPEDTACASGGLTDKELGNKAEKVAEEIKKRVEKSGGRSEPLAMIGLITLAIGVLLLLENVFGINIRFVFWPALLIIIGLLIVIAGLRR